MSSPLAEREARLELSLVFQYLGFSLIGLFFAFLLKLVLPLAILQPSWQLQWANALRTPTAFKRHSCRFEWRGPLGGFQIKDSRLMGDGGKGNVSCASFNP